MKSCPTQVIPGKSSLSVRSIRPVCPVLLVCPDHHDHHYDHNDHNDHDGNDDYDDHGYNDYHDQDCLLEIYHLQIVHKFISICKRLIRNLHSLYIALYLQSRLLTMK